VFALGAAGGAAQHIIGDSTDKSNVKVLELCGLPVNRGIIKTA
jgi:hypothetical protein